MDKKRIQEIARAIVSMREVITDEQALSAQVLYPEWKFAVSYVVGQRVLYNEVLYKVLQDHTSQADWTPDVASGLFAKVLIPDENIIPEWEQPESTNPYMSGDKVSYNDKIWVSTIDNNVWEPSVYGWEEVIE